MENVKFYASSLKATDCEKLARSYANLFSGNLVRSSSGHAEVSLPESHLLVFSRETEACPVSPGTLVWTVVKQEEDSIRGKLEASGFLRETTEAAYFSYLDPEGNRNWFYFRKET